MKPKASDKAKVVRYFEIETHLNSYVLKLHYEIFDSNVKSKTNQPWQKLDYKISLKFLR